MVDEENSIVQTLVKLQRGDAEAGRPFYRSRISIPGIPENTAVIVRTWDRMESTDDLVAQHAAKLGRAYFMRQASNGLDNLRRAAAPSIGDGLKRGATFVNENRRNIKALVELSAIEVPKVDSFAGQEYIRAGRHPAFAEGWRAQAQDLAGDVSKLSELLESPPATRKAAKARVNGALPSLVYVDPEVHVSRRTYAAVRDAVGPADEIKRAMARDAWVERRSADVSTLQAQVDAMRARVDTTPWLQDARRIADALWGEDDATPLRANASAAELENHVAHALFYEEVEVWREDHDITDPNRALAQEDNTAIEDIAGLAGEFPSTVRAALLPDAANLGPEQGYER